MSNGISLRLGVLLTLTQQVDELFCSVFLFNGLHRVVDLLDKVVEYRLQQVHAAVLAQITEVRDVIFDRH